ncbi:hypothetical protein RHMOL_Rhmol04G0231300 [Rhododendron molle]|uniref:Uncharacterized protein n=1 Tax=Rhododendron molle TaxID=49168 RepID=A0ACC0P4M2_RHOML|nr:hypothetical protein RHMOL_Rhmol04G0231300 [Rhododendron molle]
MANHLPALIDTWLETFVATDWLSFRTHGLAAFHFFRNIRLRPEILQSAVRFWDPVVHVFRYGDNELCPIVEEFQAYLQGFASHMIVIPPYRKRMSKLLKTSLNITTGAAESLLSGRQINVMRLMEWYGPEGNTGDMALQACRRFALVISVLTVYLLLWLSDKLGLIAAPEANWPRLPKRMHQREMLYPEMSTEEWIRFMDELSPEEITWRHEVLDIPDMAVKSAGSSAEQIQVSAQS